MRLAAMAGALLGLMACRHGHDIATPARRVQRDVAYLAGSRDGNTLDVYAPGAAAGAPVIVWFHGGALLEGDKQSEAVIAERFTDAGFVTIVPNYRLSPAVSHPAHVKDAAAAVAWASAHARAYGGDPARVFVAGYSAGAYLAALLVTDERYLAAQERSVKDLRGVVVVGGFFWVERPGVAPDRPKTVWGTDPTSWVDASPAHHLHSRVPPILMVYADGDDEWRQQQNREFAQALEAGTRVELVRIAGRDHETIHTNMGRPRDPAFEQIIRFVRRAAE